ncbi:MAG: SEC-C metal-binding domain-containing protein [Firmicutes bacterium]|jgi:hypothetical protein|nr:SEC-C metal-binding domain-containing protein [Bacillota bacterium]
MQITDLYEADYFMHILIDKKATLKLLDDFLRGIWLECCGHLSEFVIDKKRFLSNGPDEGSVFMDPSYGMEYSLDLFLSKGKELDYVYDFGSSSELRISVKDEYSDIQLNDAVTLLARNLPVKGDPYNSPRTGICGYEGNNSFDISSFKVSDYKANRKLVKPKKDISKMIVIEQALGSMVKDLKSRQITRSAKYYIFNKEADLDECLSIFSRDELYSFLKDMGLSGISSLKKNELYTLLKEEIPVYFLKTMNHVSSEILINYNKSLKGGVRIDLVKNDLDYAQDLFDYIKKTCLFPVHDAMETVFILPSELKEIFISKYDKELKNQASYYTKIMQMISGAAYYYGVISLNDLVDLFENTGVSLSPEQLDEIILYNIDNKSSYIYEKQRIVHNDVADIDELVAKIEDRERLFDNTPYKQFSQKELINAGKPGYYKSTQAISRFSNFVKIHYAFKGSVLKDFIIDLLFEMDQDESPSAITNFMKEHFQFPSIGVMNEVMGLVFNIYNNHRQWLLKGYTPMELNPEKIQEKITKTVVQKKVKIGRNEPCPCGSGKKYKKCCGRN